MEGRESPYCRINTGDSISCRLLQCKAGHADDRVLLATRAVEVSPPRQAKPQNLLLLRLLHLFPILLLLRDLFRGENARKTVKTYARSGTNAA